MNNRKGFTLIELLAVIVILAIIALIATPIVLNMINNSRKNASKASALGYIESIEYYTGLSQVGSNLGYTAPIPKGTCKKEKKWKSDDCKAFYGEVDKKAKGDKPEYATITIDSTGKVTAGSKISYNGYEFTYDGKSVDNPKDAEKVYICRRATILHQEECENLKSGNDYCLGAGYAKNKSKATTTITYGNLGTAGVIKTGDAYDCDVNGDEIYDPQTERFYYLSDSKENNKYSVLIYYANIKNDIPSLPAIRNDTVKAYTYDYAKGPNKIKENLPTKEKWPNVKLINNNRTILNENKEAISNNIAINNPISFEGYAARLLSLSDLENFFADTYAMAKEQNYVRNIGRLDNYLFLFENTRFSKWENPTGYWLENPVSSSAKAYELYGQHRSVGIANNTANDGYGARPVIEVKKTDIEI